MAFGKKMRPMWFMALLAFTFAGCATSVPVVPATPGATASVVAQPSPTSARLIASPTAANSAVPSAVPATATSRATTAPVPSPTATPQSNIGRPVQPTAASIGSSKTYTNADWHVAVDYPADWSVQESANITTFTSLKGATIQLALAARGSLGILELQTNDDLPNTRCTSRTNAHGISERVCFDTISFSTSAEFIVQGADGSARLLELSSARRTGDVTVLNAMLATVRSTD